LIVGLEGEKMRIKEKIKIGKIKKELLERITSKL